MAGAVRGASAGDDDQPAAVAAAGGSNGTTSGASQSRLAAAAAADEDDPAPKPHASSKSGGGEEEDGAPLQVEVSTSAELDQAVEAASRAQAKQVCRVWDCVATRSPACPVPERHTPERVRLAPPRRRRGTLSHSLSPPPPAPSSQTRVKAKVLNRLVAEDAAAELANGDGDVSTTGACAGDIRAFCRKLRPGAGRLAECLSNVADSQAAAGEDEEANSDGPKEEVSKACRAELDAFRQEAAKSVNRDVPLAKACARDIAKHCAAAGAGGRPGAVLACLRARRAALVPRCRKEVLRVQAAAADDFRVDSQLLEACAADKSRLCAEVEPHGGAVQACLHAAGGSLSWECKRELFRQEMEDSSDVRLSVKLLRKCLGDKKKVRYGAGRRLVVLAGVGNWRR